jgi:uncharacterized RDD family membrane protein YckC
VASPDEDREGGSHLNAAELRIRTPEGITFAYQLAGPVTRCLAWIVDFFVIFALIIGTWFVMGWLFAVSADLGGAFVMISLLVVPVAYGVMLEWFWRGQTIGKRAFRLRVMDADGLRLQFHQVLMRNLVRFVDILPGFYLLGGLACLISRKSQRLGDLAAGTIVVHHRKLIEPDLEQLLGTKFNSLRSQAHLCARLRQRTSPEEARIALQALIRRDEFEPPARVRLFAELANHFRSTTEIPLELIESMPDEQLIRNVVDILFRTNEVQKRGAETPPASEPVAAA